MNYNKMCGIFCYCSKKSLETDPVDEAFNTIQNRGPDHSCKENIIVDSDDLEIFFGFHRLSIMDRTEKGNQPLKLDSNITLMCNGEIYNHEELAKKNGFKMCSQSDCEVIMHLYKKFGFYKTVKMLDGVFAIILYDSAKKTLYTARDPFGVRPLYYGYDTDGGRFGFASNMKSLHKLFDKVHPYPPAHIHNTNMMSPSPFLTSADSEGNSFVKYHEITKIVEVAAELDENIVCKKIRECLTTAVRKRMMSHREIGCLLSGGLDSSLIASLVNSMHKGTQMKTFSIGMDGGTDLQYAKKVAEFLGTEHHQIIITKEEFCKAIRNVIYDIESYDTTTVRASIGNWLVSKYIKENAIDCKVIFNGDGSDEVAGGYLYFMKAPSPHAFQKETLRLMKDIHYFDVKRSDGSISSNGLEPRTPFLDKDFVDLYISIDPKFKVHSSTRMEKYILRKAFDPEFNGGTKYLPNDVLWRRKEAFSDGVSKVGDTTQSILQRYIGNIDVHVNCTCKTYCYTNPPKLGETMHYRKIFEEFFPGKASIVPYYWMPKWCEGVTDPSARDLSHYK